MAAASSIQPPSGRSSLAGESALSPEMDSPESRQPEDEEVAAAAQPTDSGISLRDLPDLEPEEIERRLAKTRQELSNRRKILIKNLPPDTTNQVHVSLRWKNWSKSSVIHLVFRFYAYRDFCASAVLHTPVCTDLSTFPYVQYVRIVGR